MFKLYDLDMREKEYPVGIIPLDIFISATNKERNRQQIEGVSGYVDYGYTDESRDVEMKILLKAYDTIDYRLLRNKAYDFFGDDMYVVENHSPGKRIKISVDERYIPERLNQRFAEVTLPGEVLEIPYFESIGTTQDIQRNGINSNDELWGFGMGLIADDEALKYTHTSRAFRIFNAGNVAVHPFEQKLKIAISNVVGSSSFLQLLNNTNGTTFRVNDSSLNGKTIVIDGPEIKINSLQEFRKTNRKYIELEPGWNNFTLTGASSAKIEFDFRFYYK